MLSTVPETINVRRKKKLMTNGVRPTYYHRLRYVFRISYP